MPKLLLHNLYYYAESVYGIAMYDRQDSEIYPHRWEPNLGPTYALSLSHLT